MVLAVIGGFLLVVGGDGAAFFGLVLVAIGGFFELVAAVAYGTVIAQRELERPVTAPSEIRALLQYLDSTDDPEQQKLRPIADGLGLRMHEARRQVEGAVGAGVIEPVGSSGHFVVTAAGLQLLEERNG